MQVNNSPVQFGGLGRSLLLGTTLGLATAGAVTTTSALDDSAAITAGRKLVKAVGNRQLINRTELTPLLTPASAGTLLGLIVVIMNSVAQSKIKRLTLNIADLEGKNNELQVKVSDSEGKVKTLKLDIQKLEGKLAEISEAHTDLQLKTGAKSAQIEKLSAELLSLLAQTEGAQKIDLGKVTVHIKGLTTDYELSVKPSPTGQAQLVITAITPKKP